jgi:gamma-glutamylcyclotransferase (GGCT)/AIG2-like uncharacterized protein YtfP
MSQRVFVYGTLMKGFPLHHRLRNGMYLGQATLEGYEMYAVGGGGYPAIVPGTGTVHGELYEVDEGTLYSLDLVEGEGYLFRKEWVEVVKEDGRKTRAWVYVYLRPLTGENRRIPSGDWKEEAKS